MSRRRIMLAIGLGMAFGGLFGATIVASSMEVTGDFGMTNLIYFGLTVGLMGIGFVTVMVFGPRRGV